MSDKMCSNKACPARERCARVMRVPSVGQKWDTFPFWDDNIDHGVVCDYLVPWNDDKGGRTMIAVFLEMLDSTADEEEVCAHFPCRGRGPWCEACPFGSVENYETFVDELNVKKEQ